MEKLANIDFFNSLGNTYGCSVWNSGVFVKNDDNELMAQMVELYPRVEKLYREIQRVANRYTDPSLGGSSGQFSSLVNGFAEAMALASARGAMLCGHLGIPDNEDY